MARFKQLWKRLTWSSLFVALAVYTIFFAPPLLFLLVVEGFIVVGLYEYLKLVARKGFNINPALGLLFGVLLPLPLYVADQMMILLIATLCLFVFNFRRHLREHATLSTALTLFGVIYVAWFFSFLTHIRAMDHGAQWVFYVILVVKGGDAAAYFTGKQFGATKFAVHISPNKSVEGAAGGFFATVALSVLSKMFLPHVPLGHFAALGVILGVLSQLGDLMESLLKRDVGAKDSGNIPGLGGVLDVMDSLLLTIPVLYYYLITMQRLNMFAP